MNLKDIFHHKKKIYGHIIVASRPNRPDVLIASSIPNKQLAHAMATALDRLPSNVGTTHKVETADYKPMPGKDQKLHMSWFA